MFVASSTSNAGQSHMTPSQCHSTAAIVPGPLSKSRALRLVEQKRHQPSAFSRQIRDLRRRFGGKQWWLAHVAGCSDAAVSFWESGKRVPGARTFSRIVEALEREGAETLELASLRQNWLAAKRRQRGAGHDAASPFGL
jgi:DNA-binding transcriptional regulator YiaG